MITQFSLEGSWLDGDDGHGRKQLNIYFRQRKTKSGFQ